MIVNHFCSKNQQMVNTVNNETYFVKVTETCGAARMETHHIIKDLE